jgi:hypothetical protein
MEAAGSSEMENFNQIGWHDIQENTAIITSSMTSYILLVYFINNKMFHINYTVMKDECD